MLTYNITGFAVEPVTRNTCHELSKVSVMAAKVLRPVDV